jgi:hypothetical protein
MGWGQENEVALYTLSDRLSVEIYVLGVGEESFLPKQRSMPSNVWTVPNAPEMAEWMEAAITRPTDRLWWTHTHPGMGAFFSSIDVDGAHELFDMVRRPIEATVLGQNEARHEELIDEDWLKKHPKVVRYQQPYSPWNDRSNMRWNNQTKTWEPDFPMYRHGRLWEGDEMDSPRSSQVVVLGLGEEFWAWFRTGGVVPQGFWSWGQRRQRKWWRHESHTSGADERTPDIESDITWLLQEYGQEKLLQTLDKMNVIQLIRNLPKKAEGH